MSNRFIKASLALGLMLSFAGAASAQPAANASDSPLAQSMAACGQIANIKQRVACYDALNRSANPAAAAERAETRRRNFGITAPHIPNPFAAPAEVKQARAAAAKHEEGVDHILARLDHSSRLPTGQLMLTTTEGAVWLLEQDSVLLEPPKGAEITIRRGAMGSLFCDLDRWRAIRCKRLE